MKKRLLLIPALFMALSGSAVAAQDTVTIPTSDYKAIIDQLKTLQKRVNALEHESPSSKPACAVIPNKLAKDVENIYDTLDEVETKTLKDRINLGAELRTRVDNFTVKKHLYFSTGATGIKESNDNSWTNRFRINMDADILKNLKFTGRLAVYKNFTNTGSVDGIAQGDSNWAHTPSDSSVKLDRAYIDWIPSGLPIPLAITFGRHPSTDGPPYELKENRKRQSTYPSLVFNGESDGIVATLGLERYTGWKNSGLRFAYGKTYQDHDKIDTYLDSTGGLNDSDIFAAFFETEIPGVDNSLLVLSAIRANEIGVDFSDSTLLNSLGKANVGDMDLYSLHIQANEAMDSNFDVFMSLGLNHTHPNGNTLNYGLAPMGLLNNDGTSNHTGWAVYTGMRYTITSAKFNNPKVGFEYNHGSEYWFSFTTGTSELYNKLATRGDVYDLYYIQPFNKNLFGRIGYSYAEYKYALSAFPIGDFGESNEQLRNAYMMLDCRF